MHIFFIRFNKIQHYNYCNYNNYYYYKMNIINLVSATQHSAGTTWILTVMWMQVDTFCPHTLAA